VKYISFDAKSGNLLIMVFVYFYLKKKTNFYNKAPIANVNPVIFIFCDSAMFIPSVFWLFSGAVVAIPSTLIFVQ
jgi:lysophospholipid acyltransferase (LPLAT)-like uncharacterized protein